MKKGTLEEIEEENSLLGLLYQTSKKGVRWWFDDETGELKSNTGTILPGRHYYRGRKNGKKCYIKNRYSGESHLAWEDRELMEQGALSD